jgi:hypothetical protein
MRLHSAFNLDPVFLRQESRPVRIISAAGFVIVLILHTAFVDWVPEQPAEELSSSMDSNFKFKI